MDDLVQLLREAIDETERIARAAVGDSVFDGTGIVTGPRWSVAMLSTSAWHIAHHDPAAVLRRCAADRKILDMWKPDPVDDLVAEFDGFRSCSDSCPPQIGAYILAALAEGYGIEA